MARIVVRMAGAMYVSFASHFSEEECFELDLPISNGNSGQVSTNIEQSAFLS
ncbi:hypothetical protein VN12_23430 [Pirellula sp. SH-Sr6A]|nr:hypothetical protein VN12_23430 [Pirellula sp. SH-Sr6A]